MFLPKATVFISLYLNQNQISSFLLVVILPKTFVWITERFHHADISHLHVTASNPDMDLCNVAALPDGGILVANYNQSSYQVKRLSNNGTEEILLCESETAVTGFVLLPPDEVLVLLSDGTIMQIRIKDGKKIYQYNVDVGRLQHGVALPDNRLLLVDYQRGEVFNYGMYFSILQGRKNVVIRKLNRPTSVARTVTNEGVLYMVSELGPHTVTIYDTHWIPKKSFGCNDSANRQLGCPESLLILPCNTVIVADQENDRITEFNLEGDFLQHVLVKSDGIKQPQRMAFQYPYLWVCSGSSQNRLACFQLLVCK